MFCPNCGKKLEVEDGLFCPSCGSPLPKDRFEAVKQAAPPAQPKAAPVAPQAEAPQVKVAAKADRSPGPEKQPRKKSRTGAVVTCVLVGLLLVALAVLVTVVLPHQKRTKQYTEGMDLLDQGQFTAAAEQFRQLGSFADAEQLAQYAEAREALRQGNYQQAADAFTQMGAFKDAPIHLATAQHELLYAQGAEALQRGDYAEALAALEQVPDLRDAAALAQQCREHIAYAEAQALFAADAYEKALARLEGVAGLPEAEALRKQCQDQLTFAQAKEQYAAGAYAEALALLESIPDLPETEALGKQCQDQLTFAQAKAQYEAGAYTEALALLEGVPDLPETKALQKQCEDRLIYAQAMEKYAAGAYSEAAELFAQIPDVDDAAKLKQECQQQLHHDKIRAALDKKDWASALALLNDSLGKSYPDRKNALQLCQNHVKYAEAVKALAEGNNYAAYLAFTALGDFEDAAAKAKSCIVNKPSTGETYRNSKYTRKDCQQWIVTPNDGVYTYMKIYCKRGTVEELVSCIFIHPGKTAKITLPAGDYIFKVAYGKGNWFGPPDMFGDDGNYQRVGGSNYVMTRKKLSSSQYYELKLRVGSGGNMGSTKVGRDGF